MSHQQNVAIAQKLLEGIGSGRDPAEIAALFDADLVFEIQGDDGVLPWIGRKTGRRAVADFIRDIRALTEPVTFDVEDILGGARWRERVTRGIEACKAFIFVISPHSVVSAFPLTPVMTWETSSTWAAGDPGVTPKIKAPALRGVTVYPRWVSAAALALD